MLDSNFVWCCCYYCFPIVNRLFLSNLCQWHTISLHIVSLLDISHHSIGSIQTFTLSEFNTNFQNRANNPRKWLFTACMMRNEEKSRRYLMMNLQWTVYFWTNERTKKNEKTNTKIDRNFIWHYSSPLHLHLSISVVYSSNGVRTHTPLRLANTWRLSTLILCDNHLSHFQKREKNRSVQREKAYDRRSTLNSLCTSMSM